MRNHNSKQIQKFSLEVRKRFWVSVIILFITTVIVIPCNYKMKQYGKTRYVENIPLNIEDWRGLELQLDKRTLEILGTDDVTFRRYFYDSREVPPVDLVIVFAEEDRKAVHPPEPCYIGGGWEIESKRYLTLSFTEPAIRGVELVVRNGEKRQLVLYWYKSGDKHTGNYYLQQMNVVINQLLHKKVSSVLIRLSTPISGKNMEEDFSRLSNFGRLLFPYIEEYIP